MTNHVVSSRGAPTEKQVKFVLKLANDRQVPQWGSTPEERVNVMQGKVDKLNRSQISDMIDWLMRQPFACQGGESDNEKLEAGVYELAGTGEIFVVKPTRDGERLYAKRLVESGGDRMTEVGKTVNVEFVYAPGAIRRIRPQDKMDSERAKELTIRYGRCINCGRKLKNATSVERGIGPVCMKAFA